MPEVDVSLGASHNEFVAFHREIVGAASELKSAVRQEAVAKTKAARLHGLVIEYLAKQNDEFYALLKSAYVCNPSALRKINFFAQDLKLLKVKIFVFEEKYLIGRRDGRNFWTRDCIEFIDDILARLQIEQAQLLPLIVNPGTSIAS